VFSLVGELAQRRHATVDPVVLGLFGRYVKHQDKVGGVSGGAERASTGTGLVDWTAVDRARLEVSRHTRLEPDQRQSVIEDLRLRLIQDHLLTVPASSLQEQTLHRSQRQLALTLWRPLLPYGYSYKASCARPG